MEENKLPEYGKIVSITVKRLTPYAAWCSIEGYPDVEGMIHVSEVAGKWVHDIRSFVKVGKKYVAKVVKIDYQKGFVNLSLKRVTKLDEREMMEGFRKEKRGGRMLEQAAKAAGKTLEEAQAEIVPALMQFGDVYTAFEEIKKSPEALEGIPKKWAEALIKVAERNFADKEITIKAELFLTSFASDGVDKVKKVLADFAEKTSAEVRYISAPKYMVEMKTKTPKLAEKKLVEGMEQAVKEITSLDGEGSYKLVK